MNENNQPPLGQPMAPVNPQFTAPAPVQPVIDPSPNPQPQKGGSMKQILLFLLVIIIGLGGGYGGYAYGKTKAPTKIVTQTVAPPSLSVPQGATVLSQCVKGKGALYALPKDIPTGPVYLVNKGKVIGLEFMVGKDDLLTAGKNFLNLPMFQQQYDHINIGLLSQGHAGFPVPHYHVDIFTVTDSVASAITCTT